VNFGDILDEWERETAKPYGKKQLKKDESAEKKREESPQSAPRTRAEQNAARANPLDVWLRRYGTRDKDAEKECEPDAESPAERRNRLRAMKPEAIIDLHGLTRDDAWLRLESFFADCVRRSLKKVLIIHGKGTHSADDPVLRGVVRLFIEQNRHAGESGHSEKDAGGTGSTWVILK
jgi:DNA-nicking Smr family endonuclease